MNKNLKVVQLSRNSPMHSLDITFSNIRKFIPNSIDVKVFVPRYESRGVFNISPMIEVSGDGACLVNPLSITDIEEGFKKLIGDDNYRNEIIRKGLINSQKYEAKKIANEYVKLYMNLSKLK
jgi:hypothetical protein